MNRSGDFEQHELVRPGVELVSLPATGAFSPAGVRVFCALLGKADPFLGTGGRRQGLACVISPPSCLPKSWGI